MWRKTIPVGETVMGQALRQGRAQHLLCGQQCRVNRMVGNVAREVSWARVRSLSKSWYGFEFLRNMVRALQAFEQEDMIWPCFFKRLLWLLCGKEGKQTGRRTPVRSLGKRGKAARSKAVTIKAIRSEIWHLCWSCHQQYLLGCFQDLAWAAGETTRLAMPPSSLSGSLHPVLGPRLPLLLNFLTPGPLELVVHYHQNPWHPQSFQ